MTFSEKTAAVPVYSFSEVVDEACEQLVDKQIKYSIRRIQKMEERLVDLERELDAFLTKKNRENQ
jgi:DNA-dependent RNA polymerase auxiliary subunit epsilon